MVETFTRDKLVFDGFRVTRDPGQDAVVFARYTKMTAAREHPTERFVKIPLNATRQSQINMMWDQALGFVLTLEESTEF